MKATADTKRGALVRATCYGSRKNYLSQVDPRDDGLGIVLNVNEEDHIFPVDVYVFRDKGTMAYRYDELEVLCD
jgi:hypothetical protein